MASKVICRTRYTAPDEEHVGIVFDKPSLTQQHFKDECDINEIARRYLQTGIMEHVSDRPAFYADVSEYPVDLATAYSMVTLAEDNFMKLPSDVRKSIDNNPALLLDWIKSHKDDSIKFGLVLPRESTSELKIESTPEPKTESSDGV